MVDGNAAGGHLFEVASRLDKGFRTLFIKRSFWAHATDNSTPANGDVGILVGQEDGGTDALVSAAGGICTLDSGQDRHTQLFQFSVPKKGGAVPSSVGIDLFLFRQLYAAAIDNPD